MLTNYNKHNTRYTLFSMSLKVYLTYFDNLVSRKCFKFYTSTTYQTSSIYPKSLYEIILRMLHTKCVGI